MHSREIPHISYFKIEVPMAAAKLRDLIAAGGDSIQGLLGRRRGHHADGRSRCRGDGCHDRGGYPDGIRQIIYPYFGRRREEALAAYACWLR